MLKGIRRSKLKKKNHILLLAYFFLCYLLIIEHELRKCSGVLFFTVCLAQKAEEEEELEKETKEKEAQREEKENVMLVRCKISENIFSRI